MFFTNSARSKKCKSIKISKETNFSTASSLDASCARTANLPAAASKKESGNGWCNRHSMEPADESQLLNEAQQLQLSSTIGQKRGESECE
ncbi:hypothetical protein AVEN_256183-1 [Araneus ventricosus]|uniref:Uncharacterized protein n=1 Tax=Araneus ventricosus TaxID=182803 RepID=A0A4Y2VEF0_ARAVE|nr:hypothetical protein AVEN_256183-1 [Araneus ventricosus]